MKLQVNTKWGVCNRNSISLWTKLAALSALAQRGCEQDANLFGYCRASSKHFLRSSLFSLTSLISYFLSQVSLKLLYDLRRLFSFSTMTSTGTTYLHLAAPHRVKTAATRTPSLALFQGQAQVKLSQSWAACLGRSYQEHMSLTTKVLGSQRHTNPTMIHRGLSALKGGSRGCLCIWLGCLLGEVF